MTRPEVIAILTASGLVTVRKILRENPCFEIELKAEDWWWCVVGSICIAILFET